MKTRHILFACLIAALSATTAAQAQHTRKMPRQTLTASFGQKKVQMEAPRGMCFLDATDLAQGNIITSMRLNSWKGRKNVVMAVFADCREVANMPVSKDAVPLTHVGVIRWLNPDIGTHTLLPLDEYLTIREVAYRSAVANDLTQFKQVKLEKDVKRLDQAIAIGYVGRSEIDSQSYRTIGVDATTLLRDIPVDISISKTLSNLDKRRDDTEKLYALMSDFVNQQRFINKDK